MPLPTALITGCSNGGIGSALALALHAQNIHIFATARDQSKMSDLAHLTNITFLTLDVTNGQHIKDAVETVTTQTGGSLDHLINNAGHGRFMPTLDQNLHEARELFEGNLWGPIAVTQAFAPLLMNAKGKITFITSVAGHANTPYLGVYAASKGSMEIMAETLRLELAPFGVKVLSVVTGAVESMGLSKGVGFELPPDSLYKSIEGTIAANARGDDGIVCEDRSVYAGKVADEILGKAEGKVWFGKYAGFAKVGTACFPGGVMDNMIQRGYGLDDLAEQRKSEM